MKVIILCLCFLIFLPQISRANDYADVFVKIEEKLMARDFTSAKSILDSSSIRQDRQLYRSVVDEIGAISDFSDKCQDFFSLASKPGEEMNAIANYAPLVNAYNSLPDKLHFSERYVGFINSAIHKAEQYVQNECGKDYGQIRAGMKLSRVQKCNGEFYLHGQVQWKGRTVDYYTRGDAFLYIKNGRVVAWGE